MLRRSLLWLAAGAVPRIAGQLARASSGDLPWANLAGATDERSEFAYRVDATVLLFGVPVVRRSGVGAARMAFRQVANPDSRRISLEFAAYSDPARAHGLNRAGWIRELVLERAATPQSATVLGIMSDSPEENAADARKVISGPAGAPRFVAIDSRHDSGETRSRVARFARAGGATLSAGMADAARASLAESPSEWRRTSREGVASPFLYAILRALESGKSETHYVYNEDDYRLQLTRSTGQSALVHVTGKLQNMKRRGRPLSFQFWTEPGKTATLPTRIEFQPRSFLSLRLEKTGVSQTAAQALTTGKAGA